MSADRAMSLVLEWSGRRVSNTEDLRYQDAVNPTGYRIHLASPTRVLGQMTRHQRPWIGPDKKHHGLPFPVRRIVAFDVYAPDGRLLTIEPTFRWAVAQAVNHMFSGAVL